MGESSVFSRLLNDKTSLTNLVGQRGDTGTLRSLKAAHQYGQLFLESKSYLERLKLAHPVRVHFEENRLLIDDVGIDLTVAELNIMSYLYQNRNKVCTYQELGDIIWNGNDDKYSMYAISKHLANIRKKVSEAGFTNTLVQVARKQGVILAI